MIGARARDSGADMATSSAAVTRRSASWSGRPRSTAAILGVAEFAATRSGGDASPSPVPAPPRPCSRPGRQSASRPPRQALHRTRRSVRINASPLRTNSPSARARMGLPSRQASMSTSTSTAAAVVSCSSAAPRGAAPGHRAVKAGDQRLT